MVITETKRQMHETLELKEEEIAQLRSCIKQMTTQGEELREQKEKSERAAFEELERALSTAQKTEEAQRRMKAEMDEQIKAIERTSEEERLSLQHELSRVKQEAVDIMKEKSQSEYLKLTQEKEQQGSLALEELELQKKAILTESENKLQELQQEAETYRTSREDIRFTNLLGLFHTDLQSEIDIL
ncbi:golgin subfamily A member 4-like [Nannospalax galili]|uniref:golgin subfamily A member 4-like n=1 Tax=Nannospalax galili TaxID=1026970 RepID=UPI0004ED3E8E|nr:golgin subfamily A member 4-like [Nannospalax galili]